MATRQPVPTATRARILTILRKHGPLRQYQVAEHLGLAEHHDWSTHAFLNQLLAEQVIYSEKCYILCVNGRLSRKPYRFFSCLPSKWDCLVDQFLRLIGR